MSDLTVYAEALIATVARAFYDDEAVCLVDVLLRDKFLRDDDMGPRLSLPAKQLRRTLQFLTDEHIVKFELVNDLSYGGSQNTKFWYVDYNHAVNSIRLRLHLLRKKLEQAELRARSSSFYLCPGYKVKRCNGRYTETEAQQLVDANTGFFLCQECVQVYAADPQPPPIETYTLELVDNAKALKQAVDNLRRFHVQLSGKMIGSHQFRASIYDLLQRVRSGKEKGPLSSNLPSENVALGIGSERLAGTGRTAGIRAKKLAQQGLVGPGLTSHGGTGHKDDYNDLTFLKNAIGQELALSVEKGGGARANLLATNRRRRRKLMDAAASRIGTDLPLHVKILLGKRKRQEQEQAQNSNKEAKTGSTLGFYFLENNIGRTRREEELEEARRRELIQEEEDEAEIENLQGAQGVILSDDSHNMLDLTEEERRAAFQSLYKREMERQIALLRLSPEKKPGDAPGPPTLVDDESHDEASVTWEDG